MERVDYRDKDTHKQAIVAPECCPACKSGDLSTTSKTIDEGTYWRCRACGEVWNASRRHEPERWPFRR
jgi:ribosomal protein L37AE/L43A